MVRGEKTVGVYVGSSNKLKRRVQVILYDETFYFYTFRFVSLMSGVIVEMVCIDMLKYNT